MSDPDAPPPPLISFGIKAFIFAALMALGAGVVGMAVLRPNRPVAQCDMSEPDDEGCTPATADQYAHSHTGGSGVFFYPGFRSSRFGASRYGGDGRSSSGAEESVGHAGFGKGAGAHGAGGE
ncbi:hypothetical protein ACI01nite_23030 [Acetobacter cibinongensis]|uniref:Uncharacterized protein n=1 Tax=Acetobacter cibinongensis TaxID=146475 RepID=A0A0D6N751_9PROT|nr:hypothetical protein [Acetobacter cibinongensis]GAN61393.1 hypothetical protein Abci_019_007 [Acetobacter cibinongensis]GEL59701.1 hypothetical protein ACI01nite_23030 [Acetobacter cibinongensis]